MQYWQLIGDKFAALSKRERWITFAALLVAVYALLNAILLSPVLTRMHSLSNELQTDQTQIQSLTQQLDAYSHNPAVDPDALNKERIAKLQANLQQLETQLNSLQTRLISPEKMPELLRNLLKKNGKLKLIELTTLPTKGLLKAAADDVKTSSQTVVADTQSQAIKNTQTESPVFKHGVEITVEGRYLDLLDYVTELEKMPWHILWSKVDLTVKDYPINQLKLTVYTLSLDKTWLSI